jgi:hypothetical protein
VLSQHQKIQLTELDKLIKKTLDEDFFDKKDRIIDTLNVKAARDRKKYSYNQQVQEEPSQLNFYDDIVQSNFRTKTGPFFDYQKRKNKAGGGILKQAGDSIRPTARIRTKLTRVARSNETWYENIGVLNGRNR